MVVESYLHNLHQSDSQTSLGLTSYVKSDLDGILTTQRCKEQNWSPALMRIIGSNHLEDSARKSQILHKSSVYCDQSTS